MTANPSPSARPLFVAVAPNGARRTKADHPALPMTPAELASTAAACREAGASMIHLHVRDAEGRHSLDAAAYRDAIAAIAKAVGDELVVQITTEAVGRYEPEEQMAVVRAVRPEAASVALREFVPDAAAEATAARFFAWAARERIVAQYILHRPDEVPRFQDLRRRGIVPGDRHFVLFVLGRYSIGQAPTPDDLAPYLAAADDAMDWAICAFGPREHDCMLAAASAGGHCRVGFENNLYLGDGRLAPDNAALVREIAAAAPGLDRRVADAAALRGLTAGTAGGQETAA